MLKRNSTYGSYSSTDILDDDDWGYGNGPETGAGEYNGRIIGFAAIDTIAFRPPINGGCIQYDRECGIGIGCGGGTSHGNGEGITRCSTGYESARGLMCQPDNYNDEDE